MIKISVQESIPFQDKEIVLLRISNSSGAYAEITNIGASIASIVVPDNKGKLNNIVLHYNNPEDYLSDPFYLGCTVGRYANRISNARFALNGYIYHVDKNDGENSNHGGFNGFNGKIFDYKTDTDSITFYIESMDGEGGFPGNLRFSTTYSFTENNELIIEYKALSDKCTPVNFTNHTYFNLSASNNNILSHKLRIESSNYLEMNDSFLPTGRICSVGGTAFDFHDYKSIEEMAQLKQDNLKGYNAFFIKNIDLESDMPVASILDEKSGCIVDIYTSMPGIQLYTGDFLSKQFIPFGGLCLEAQYHPDGVNHPHFETNILTPDIEKTDSIKYLFR